MTSDLKWGVEETLILVSLSFFGKIWEGGGGLASPSLHFGLENKRRMKVKD